MLQGKVQGSSVEIGSRESGVGSRESGKKGYFHGSGGFLGDDVFLESGEWK